MSTDGATLQRLGLSDGSTVEVAVRSCLQVPPAFSATLNSRKRIMSSAFIARYELKVRVPQNTVQMKLWRKNDHDSFTMDTAAGTISGSTQHWMCGNKPLEEPLGFRMELA